MAHLEFKLLQVLVVVLPGYVEIPNKFGNMSFLRYLRLKGEFCRSKLPNSIVKLKCLETVDIGKRATQLPSGVWESKQLRHLRCGGFYQASKGCFSISPNMYALPPSNLQTLMWIEDKFFESRLLQGLSKLRKLGMKNVYDSTIKVLAASSPMSKALELLKLEFYRVPSEQINLSSYPNIVKLSMYAPCPPRVIYGPIMPIIDFKIEAFPPNLVKLTLFRFKVDGHLLAMLKKLPKLRIFKMLRCKLNGETMDQANGDSFLQLEVLHIEEPLYLAQVSCSDDVRMPKLK